MYTVDAIRREIAAEEIRCRNALVFTAEAHRRKLQALRQELAIVTAEQDAEIIAAEIAAAAHI